MAHYHSHKRRTANGRMKMAEIEITFSDTEFQLKNGFTMVMPFEVCAVASATVEHGDLCDVNLEIVIGAKGENVPVYVSDFVAAWFLENEDWYHTKFYENLGDYCGRDPDEAYERRRDERAMGFEL